MRAARRRSGILEDMVEGVLLGVLGLIGVVGLVLGLAAAIAMAKNAYPK
jgi:hypothetical protein